MALLYYELSAGPVDGPSHLITAEMFAPRPNMQRGVAVMMKRTLPRGATYEDRALALAKRLNIDTPAQPLTNAQWTELWASIGKVLLTIEPPEPVTLKTLWADVGIFLAELREPEFQWGPGRRPGSKARKRRILVPNVTQEAIRQRRSRARKS